MLTFTVNTLNNESDGIDVGNISLREAIEAANSTPGKDTINFQDSLTGGIIDIGGYLNISDDVIITGLGKNNLNIDGSLYLQNPTAEATISALTIKDLNILGNENIQVNLDNLKIPGGIYTQQLSQISINLNQSETSEIFTNLIQQSVSLNLNESTVSGDINLLNTYLGTDVDIDLNNSEVENGGISLLYGDNIDINVNNSVISGNNGAGIETNTFGLTSLFEFLVVNRPYANINISNSTIANHSSDGIVLEHGKLTIENSNIINNQDDGIETKIDSDVIITNSTIANNLLNGITNNYGSVDLTNSTISSNGGTGIVNSSKESYSFYDYYFNLEGVSTVKNSTITANNRGIFNGADIENNQEIVESTTTVINSIISENQDQDVINENDNEANGIFISQGNNIVGTGNGVENFTQPTDQINTNPKLNPLANNGGYTLTHLPKTDSPAIDAGNKQLLPQDTSDLDKDGNKTEPIPFDQRGVGFTRVFGSELDIGAVELQSQPTQSTTVSVTVSPTSVIENGTTNLIYTFKRTGNISSTLSNVKFNVSGTATFNNDYTQGGASSFSSTTGTLKFGANQDTKTITINPTGDTVIEPNEIVKLTLVNGTDYKALSPTNATATIINDDNTVSVTVSPTSVIENGTTNLIYTFKRTGNISSTLSNVKFNVSGTATFNNDYTQGGASSFSSTTGTLKFAANQDTKTITINPKGDTVIEPNEIVKLTLVNGTDYKALSPTNATATIINDDNTVSVTVSPTSVIENGTTNLIYTFKRTGNISTALSNVKFNVSGTATFNNDYTQGGASSFSSTTGTLKFAANQDTKTITINPKGDTVIEPNEIVKLTLVNGTDYKALSPTNATGTIINDDVNSLLQHNSDLVALINPEVGGIFLA